MDRTFTEAERVVRAIDPFDAGRAAGSGGQRLPYHGDRPVLTHIAEHTQRHVGQAISAAKLAVRLGAA